MKRMYVFTVAALIGAGTMAHAADRDRSLVVTSSNTAANQLLVYDTAGQLLQTVSTQGQGGVGNNAGGIASDRGTVAVVNFGSGNVSVFQLGDAGFTLADVLPVASQPLSVAFANDHLYVLGTTTVESHRASAGVVESAPDGIASLLAADGSAAQVGATADELIVSEKSGTIEVVRLRAGGIDGAPRPVALPQGQSDTPFGLVTRGANSYVTIAHSDLVGLVKDAALQAVAATGVVGGQGQHSPCWIAVAGPFLFTSNSPSRSISRLVATGDSVTLDRAVVAQTTGAPIDIAAKGGLLAVIESIGGGTARVSQFRITDDGDLVPTATTPIAAPANGVTIVPASAR